MKPGVWPSGQIRVAPIFFRNVSSSTPLTPTSSSTATTAPRIRCVTTSTSNYSSSWLAKMSKLRVIAASENSMHRRLVRELKTVKAMIRIYCKAHHRSSGPCEQCTELSQYAERRLANCPFQEQKPTCGKCAVHCYKPEMRRKIIEVMRFSGPRMMFHYPVLAIAHLIDEKRSLKPEESTKNTQKRKRP